MNPPVIYIAGPMGNDEETEGRVMKGILAGEEVWKAGGIPLVPHLHFWWEKEHPHSWEEWLHLDEHLILRCDALFNYAPDEPSIGRDREVRFCKSKGIPALCSMEDVLRFIEGGINAQ